MFKKIQEKIKKKNIIDDENIENSSFSLDLRYKKLGKRNDLLKTCKKIDRNVVSLCLSDNKLADKKTSVLIKAFQELPALTELDLSSNEFHKKEIGDLISIIKALPTSLKTLNLGSNSLFIRPINEVILLLQAMPPHISSLSFCNSGLIYSQINYLDHQVTPVYRSPEEIINILKNIPPSIRMLDLSYNFLQGLSPENLAKAFDALPKNIISINLANPAIFSEEQTAAIISVLKKSKICTLTMNIDKNQTEEIESVLANNALKSTPLLNKGLQELCVKTLFFSNAPTELPDEQRLLKENLDTAIDILEDKNQATKK